jgi:hypothetical protein
MKWLKLSILTALAGLGWPLLVSAGDNQSAPRVEVSDYGKSEDGIDEALAKLNDFRSWVTMATVAGKGVAVGGAIVQRSDKVAEIVGGVGRASKSEVPRQLRWVDPMEMINDVLMDGIIRTYASAVRSIAGGNERGVPGLDFTRATKTTLPHDVVIIEQHGDPKLLSWFVGQQNRVQDHSNVDVTIWSSSRAVVDVPATPRAATTIAEVARTSAENWQRFWNKVDQGDDRRLQHHDGQVGGIWSRSASSSLARDALGPSPPVSTPRAYTPPLSATTPPPYTLPNTQTPTPMTARPYVAPSRHDEPPSYTPPPRRPDLPSYTPPPRRFDPPSYTPPPRRFDPPSFTPPSFTPPSFTPPSYTPPSYTPPSYTPPSYTPPSYTPPLYTPPRRY